MIGLVAKITLTCPRCLWTARRLRHWYRRTAICPRCDVELEGPYRKPEGFVLHGAGIGRGRG